jgi:hypothetical protein
VNKRHKNTCESHIRSDMEVALAHCRTTSCIWPQEVWKTIKMATIVSPITNTNQMPFQSVMYSKSSPVTSHAFHTLYQINSQHKVSVLTPHNFIIKCTLLHFTCTGKANKITCIDQKLIREIRTIK